MSQSTSSRSRRTRTGSLFTRRARRSSGGSPSEYQIQRAIVAFLQLRERPGLCWFHVPNQSTEGPKRGAFLKAMGKRSGAPDLVLIYKGRPLALELKAEPGKLSQSQRDFSFEWEAAGGVYFVAYNFDMALRMLRIWGIE